MDSEHSFYIDSSAFAGAQCMCSECAKVLRFQTNRCPICRTPVERLLEIKVPKNGSELNITTESNSNDQPSEAVESSSSQSQLPQKKTTPVKENGKITDETGPSHG